MNSGLRAVDRTRESLVKRRVIVDRRLMDLTTKVSELEQERGVLNETIEQLDAVAISLARMAGPPARVTQRPVPALTEEQLTSANGEHRPITDIERVRLALSLEGEMNTWQIAKAAGVPSNSVSVYLGQLVKKGSVVLVRRGRYRVAEKPSSDKEDLR